MSTNAATKPIMIPPKGKSYDTTFEVQYFSASVESYFGVNFCSVCERYGHTSQKHKKLMEKLKKDLDSDSDSEAEEKHDRHDKHNKNYGKVKSAPIKNRDN